MKSKRTYHHEMNMNTKNQIFSRTFNFSNYSSRDIRKNDVVISITLDPLSNIGILQNSQFYLVRILQPLRGRVSNKNRKENVFVYCVFMNKMYVYTLFR
jgi:hypothetical protein